MAITNLIAAGKNDFLVYEGDTTPATITFTTTEGNNPVSLAGATIQMDIRKKAGGELVDSFSTVGDIVISGAGNNVLTISGWERLPFGNYVYDLEVIQSGNVTTYLVGKVKVTRDITE